jgi:HEAT repeat protein
MLKRFVLRFNALNQLQSLVAPFWETNPVNLDKETREMLLTLIKNEKSWLQAAAIRFLGMTRDPLYADLYISYLNDQSDRVVGSAAAALGKTRSPKAFDELVKLVNRPSMKSQSLRSALNGLKELGDPRAYEIAYNSLADLKLRRWRLPTPPVWDYRIIAAQTIASLSKSESAFPLILERFKVSMSENDVQGIFNNILLITALADPRGQEAFDMLKEKYKDDPVILDAAIGHETSFKSVISQ